MPRCERILLIPYGGQNHIIKNCESSDARAVKEAVHELERREGKMRGSIKIKFNDVLITLK